MIKLTLDSPMVDEAKKQMAEIFTTHTRILETPDAGVEKVVPAKNQVCADFENYCKPSTWNQLRNDEVSLRSKLVLLAELCFLIGLLNPDEKTVRDIVAIAFIT